MTLRNVIATIEAFNMLTVCYNEPTEELPVLLRNSLDRLTPLSEEVASLADKLNTAAARIDLQELLKDYAKLFVGPFQLQAPPFGSVYLDDTGQLMGESTMRLKDLYLEAGLEIAEDFKNPPDHIAAELEFLSFLLQMEQRAEPGGDEHYQELRMRFLDEHLGRWFQQFTDKVVENAETEFYRTLGLLTRLCVREQINELEALQLATR